MAPTNPSRRIHFRPSLLDSFIAGVVSPRPATALTDDPQKQAGKRVQARGFMNPEIMHDVLEMIEAEVQKRPAPLDFEMAYQVRLSIDRIRFAIKHTEQFCPQSDQVREAGFQLLDALERLENV